jgi:imidazolonepropionase-like amidohydrolase
MNGPALVFVGVALVSLRGPGLEPDQTVIVEGDRITYVGPSKSASLPQDARRIDGGGRFLMPGLADMHVHLHFADELGVYLAHGITTVRNMRGEPRHLAWREDVRAGRLAGPTILTSGPTLGGSPLLNPDFRAVDSPGEASRAVAEQAAAGYELVKVHSRLKPEVYEAVAKAGREHRLPVVGHYLPETGIDIQVRERQASLEHVWDMERFLEADPSPARRIAAAGTFVTPLIATDYERTAPPADLVGLLARKPRTWTGPSPRTRLAMSHLRSAGVRFLIGTDASLPAMRPGESLGLEMRSLLASGLTAREVLEAATRNAGAFVGERLANPGRPSGTIETGARADLLLLDANPLEDPTRGLAPRLVVAKGRLFETSDLARWRAAR